LKRHQNIHLFYLPTYSPEYNPVELFWKWIKPKVYGFSALGGIAELISRFRKLVWHYNKGTLHRPIKFNFKAYGKLL
jgi:transposase